MFAVLPLVIERLSHPRESVRKKAVMALHHFYQMDPERSGPLAGKQQSGIGLNPGCWGLLCKTDMSIPNLVALQVVNQQSQHQLGTVLNSA